MKVIRWRGEQIGHITDDEIQITEKPAPPARVWFAWMRCEFPEERLRVNINGRRMRSGEPWRYDEPYPSEQIAEQRGLDIAAQINRDCPPQIPSKTFFHDALPAGEKPPG